MLQEEDTRAERCWEERRHVGRPCQRGRGRATSRAGGSGRVADRRASRVSERRARVGLKGRRRWLAGLRRWRGWETGRTGEVGRGGKGKVGHLGWSAGWAGLVCSGLPSFSISQTNSNLFEFKLNFEFKPYAFNQIKPMHQHECNNKFKPRNFLITCETKLD